MDILTGDRRWGQTSCRFYLVLGLQPNKKSDKQQASKSNVKGLPQDHCCKALIFSCVYELKWHKSAFGHTASERPPSQNMRAIFPLHEGTAEAQHGVRCLGSSRHSGQQAKAAKTSESWLDWSAMLVSVGWCTCTKPKCKNCICCQLASKNPFTQTHVAFCNETDLLQAGRWALESCL